MVMRRRLILTFVLSLLAAQGTMANPLPAYYIDYVRAYPPQIRVASYQIADLSGDTIFTSAGIAIIDSGVFTSYRGLILDSTNTSGFVLNPEADSITLGFAESEPAKWGTKHISAPPIKGHSTYWTMYAQMSYCFTFDFATPRFGATQIVINEINSHCDWGNLCNFIELYNFGNSEISLANWKIVCDTICSLPDNARIGPHGFYVLDESNFPSIFDMDFDADNIYLINASNQLVDQVGWSSDHGLDVSFMRFPDGDTIPQDWRRSFWGYNDLTSFSFNDGFPTRGAANRFYGPGLKVIGIHANAIDGKADIYWTNPIWMSVFTEAILHRSTESYPQTPFDGDIVYEGSGQELIGDTLTPGVRYYYTVFARTSCGDYSEPDSESQISIMIPTQGIEDEPIPEKAALLACYPNPFNGSTLIRYNLTSPGRVRLAIYNLAGQRVTTLYDGNQNVGEHNVLWNGNGQSSGVYFARLESGRTQNSIKLILMK
jgi:hypothetical protein